MNFVRPFPISLRHFLRTCFAALVLTSAAFAAAPYKVGDVFESFSTQDAKENAYSYQPGSLGTLIVSYTMSNGKTVNGFLAAQPTDFLDSHRAAFLADIHGMPSVGRFFALPKMKRYPHRILLGDADDLLARHPKVEDNITIFDFDAKGVITSIRHLDPEKQLDQLFTAAAPAAKP